MCCRDGRTALPWLAVLILVVCAHRLLAAEPIEFSVIELPPVITTEGAFDFIRPVALNNRGQVAGEALGGSVGGHVFSYWVAFLYGPTKGSQVLDPYGSLQSTALFLNEKGQVLGESCCTRKDRRRFFRAVSPSKFNLLKKGWSGWIRNDFEPTAFTDRGDVAGYSTRYSEPWHYRRKPVLYLRGRGWIDLTQRDERLSQHVSSDEVLRLNRYRDFVVPIEDGVLGGFAGKEPIEVGPAAMENTIGELSDAAELVGEIHVPSIKYSPRGPMRAYLFTPAEGLSEIHEGRFEDSIAVWISSDGAVGGYATRRREFDTLFTWDRQDGLEEINLRRELRRLDRSLQFGSQIAKDMNDRLQFIGEIQTRDEADSDHGPFSGRLVHYLWDPEARLIDLQHVVDEAGLEADVFWLVDLNDAGQILVEVRRRLDDSRAGVLLTPKSREAPPS